MTEEMDTETPLYFLWEIVPFDDELRLGYIDDTPEGTGGYIRGVPMSLWKRWTELDYRGAMPRNVAPERFYLWSPLRSRGAVGDYSGVRDRIVKVVSNRFLDALRKVGAENYQVFPLTFWRRSEPLLPAPSPDPTETLSAFYSWEEVDIIDYERSAVEKMDLLHRERYLTRHPHHLEWGGPYPVLYYRATRLELRDPLPKVLPPLYRIRGIPDRRYVSPQFADLLRASNLKVRLVQRYLNLERLSLIREGILAQRTFARPPEVALGE